MKNKKLTSRDLYAGKIIKLRLDEVELPDGRHAEREIIEHPGAAAIVPLDADGQVRFVRQYRDAVQKELLEIPAGKLKPGENPKDCALRELEEELGITADRVTHMATFYSTPGFCDEVMHMFLAEDLRSGNGDVHREQFIDEDRRALEPVEPLAAELHDAKSLVGVLLAHQIVISRI